ncbi:YfgM family protein [Thorsellia kenyensis]|uniref:Ancillary SecYEG translocon subunit n=1 Tax=Thorsellia kenyensis TaxID=1549888 RepID=A0ABV6CCJ4_9GAMM
MQTDNEQFDQFKTFLKENGIAITVGIVIGVGGLVGWNFYEKHQVKTVQNEAAEYYTTITALNKSKELIVEEGTENPEKQKTYEQIRAYLKTDESNYVGIVALAFAKELAAEKSFKEAEAVLSDVSRKNIDKNLASSINYMLANLQSEQKKFDDAIATLNTIPTNEWGANRFELKADILKRKGDIQEARKLYEQAITVADPSIQEYLRVKLNNLPS